MMMRIRREVLLSRFGSSQKDRPRGRWALSFSQPATAQPHRGAHRSPQQRKKVGHLPLSTPSGKSHTSAHRKAVTTLLTPKTGASRAGSAACLNPAFHTLLRRALFRSMHNPQRPVSTVRRSPAKFNLLITRPECRKSAAFRYTMQLFRGRRFIRLIVDVTDSLRAGRTLGPWSNLRTSSE